MNGIEPPQIFGAAETGNFVINYVSITLTADISPSLKDAFIMDDTYHDLSRAGSAVGIQPGKLSVNALRRDRGRITWLIEPEPLVSRFYGL